MRQKHGWLFEEKEKFKSIYHGDNSKIIKHVCTTLLNVLKFVS